MAQAKKDKRKFGRCIHTAREIMACFFSLVLSLFPSFSDDLQDETEESIVKRTVDRLWSSKKWREES